MTGRASRFALTDLERLRPHEEVDEEAAKRLADEIRTDDVVQSPVIVDEGTRVILDGHHRYTALVQLGCRLAPSYLIDYTDPNVRVEHWDDGRPMDKTELISKALSGDLYPRKTSRHRTLGGLPDRPTPLGHLRPGGDAA